MTSRTLVISHNHPSLHPGGTEVFSHALFRELKRRRGSEVMYVACTNKVHREPNPGTAFLGVNEAPDELLLWAGSFDRFRLSQIDLHGTVPELLRLLRGYRPEVVHFHHVLLIGVEAIKLVRDTLPDARIVLTLHDYYPICHNDGQMIRTGSAELCERASPQSCAGCFPDHGTDEFLTREVHIKQFFSLVDVFVAPSRFLRERYVAWGLDPARVHVIGNGSTHRAAGRTATPEPRPGPKSSSTRGSGRGDRRTVFGFFGNVSRAKGIHVLLDAIDLLRRRHDRGFEVRIHGKPWFQSDEFVRELQHRLAKSGRVVSHRGGYRRDQMPALLAGVDWVVVPSIWWENDPLVIQEALWAHRPVICANIGGMAEAVRPGRDGLHFRARDPHHLAAVMAAVIDGRAPSALELRSPPSIERVADSYLEVYGHATAAAGRSQARLSAGA